MPLKFAQVYTSLVNFYHYDMASQLGPSIHHHTEEFALF